MSNFIKNSLAEAWLTNRGVEWKWRSNVSMTDLRPGWDEINHGRPEQTPIDQDLVLRYAEAFEAGSSFPGVLFCSADGTYDVLDGDQRLSANALCGHNVFSGYEVLETRPDLREAIRRCANSVLNGTSPSETWQVETIIDLLFESFKWTLPVCASWSGFKVDRLRAEVDARVGRRWMLDNGIPLDLKPANHKGFCQAFSHCVSRDMRTEAPKECAKIVRFFQQIKSNNGEAIKLLSEVAELKKKKGVRYGTQIDSKLKEWYVRPEYDGRLRGRRKNHPIDNVVRALAGALTAARNAKGNSADSQQAAHLVGGLESLKTVVRRLVPREYWATESDIIV